VVQVEFAAKLARQALRVAVTTRPAWLTLARCYVKLGLHQLALITLNVVPTPPVPTEDWEVLHVEVPLKSARVRFPAQRTALKYIAKYCAEVHR
jgi:ChAPs (Chs5p-Arf1p-binding proteins)